jgi:hypothetical protein
MFVSYRSHLSLLLIDSCNAAPLIVLFCLSTTMIIDIVMYSTYRQNNFCQVLVFPFRFSAHPLPLFAH